MALKNMYGRSGLGRALLAALASIVGGGASAFAGGTQYYMNDHLATTVGIADAAGEIAALEADAFGSPIAAGTNPGRYTGKPYDADMGAYVFPFRNYRADEGRWMTADPSGFPDGLNARLYAPGASLLACDPLGLVTVSTTVSDTYQWAQTHSVSATNSGEVRYYWSDDSQKNLTGDPVFFGTGGWTGNGVAGTNGSFINEHTETVQGVNPITYDVTVVWQLGALSYSGILTQNGEGDNAGKKRNYFTVSLAGTRGVSYDQDPAKNSSKAMTNPWTRTIYGKWYE